MTGYEARIIDASMELSAKDRIKMKDITAMTPLDQAVTDETGIVIAPIGYAIVSVHNEKSDNKDYEKYVIVTQDELYVTGSQPFFSTFKGIWDEMNGVQDEMWELRIYKLESKNYKGKSFLTCTIM